MCGMCFVRARAPFLCSCPRHCDGVDSDACAYYKQFNLIFLLVAVGIWFVGLWVRTMRDSGLQHVGMVFLRQISAMIELTTDAVV